VELAGRYCGADHRDHRRGRDRVADGDARRPMNPVSAIVSAISTILMLSVCPIAANPAVAADDASVYRYKTARGLYRDCTAAQNGGGDAPTRHNRCAEYLEQMLDVWNLEQGPGTCSRRSGEELPDAYVTYWRKRGLGFLSGEFRSAKSSAMDFFNSQKRLCSKTGQR
jgi:hypothetical protein